MKGNFDVRSGNAEWAGLSNQQRSAKSLWPLPFLARVENAQSMLYNGVEPSVVRAKHGGVVLEAAIEMNRRSLQ